MSVIDPKLLMDLLWAVKNGDLEKVQEIVDNQPDKVPTQNHLGNYFIYLVTGNVKSI